MFGVRNVGTKQKCFSSTDLISYIEAVMKTLEKNSRRHVYSRTSYSWLSSGNKKNSVSHEMEELRPFVDKLSPESCTSVAFQLDKLLEETDVTPSAILLCLKHLLKEEYDCQMIHENVKRKSIKRNHVQPILIPPGREATVSFILTDSY